MKIIRTYILKECVMPFIISMVVLTGVFMLGNLFKLTNLVINKGVPLASVGKGLLLSIPALMGYMLPAACLVGVIMAFSRLSTDNEIVALRASGLHLWRILVPLIFVGVIMSLVSLILYERLIPYASHEQRRLLKHIGLENPTALLEPGLFIHAFEGQVLFIHRLERNNLFNVTIYQPQKDGPTRTIIAKKGEFTPVPGKDQIKLKLIEGTSDEPNPNNPNKFYKLNFQNYFMTLDLSGKDDALDKKPKSMTFKELNAEIERLERKFVNTVRLRAEYWKKITWSAAPLFFILLGFPIAVITNRRGKSANIVLAVICAAAYYLVSLGAEALAIKEILQPAIIMWLPNLAALLVALYLNLRCVS